MKNISGKKIKYYKVAGLSVDKKKKLVEEHLKHYVKNCYDIKAIIT